MESEVPPSGGWMQRLRSPFLGQSLKQFRHRGRAKEESHPQYHRSGREGLKMAVAQERRTMESWLLVSHLDTSWAGEVRVSSNLETKCSHPPSKEYEHDMGRRDESGTVQSKIVQKLESAAVNEEVDIVGISSSAPNTITYFHLCGAETTRASCAASLKSCSQGPEVFVWTELL
ncbi:hypothetical protein SRHO_G00211610 [Serrasalmus rhombeus]